MYSLESKILEYLPDARLRRLEIQAACTSVSLKEAVNLSVFGRRGEQGEGPGHITLFTWLASLMI